MATRRSKPATQRRSAAAGPPPLTGALRKLMDAAVNRHRTGEAAQAEAMYREIARQAPGHPDVHHLLGLALHHQGRHVEARAELRSAIAAFEPAPHYHNSLGEVLLASGSADEAVGCFERALQLDTDALPALNNLGLALHGTGRFAEAAETFMEVARRQPQLSHAHNNLGIARQSQGDLEGAAQSFRTACELAPDQAQAWNNLGAVLHDAGQLDAAQQALEKALEREPSLARAHFNLSRLRISRDDAEGALESIQRAMELEPLEAEYHVQKGLILRAAGRLDESVQALRAALEHSPRHPIAHNDLGVSLLMDGEFAQAEHHLLAAIDAAPQLAIAYENLARARRFGPGDAALMKRIEDLRAATAVASGARMHLDFALAKMWDDRGEPERAFGYMISANREKRAQVPWDRAGRSDHVDRIMRVFDGDWFASRQGVEYGHPSTAPVLIVGMPRSGTTLVEQILASHPQVQACGETEFFANLAGSMARRLGVEGETYPECATRLTPSDLDAIATSYLSQTFTNPAQTSRFTDKNPLNFDHLGLAAVLFPNARLIHVTRDPLATCLSVYMTHFMRDNAFAYDLEDIAAFYRDYQRLMEHWHGILGERLYRVAYEDIVASQEETSRALLTHCGLEWDPVCLDFHRTRRTVGTASHWQVRQPLYSAAVDRGQRYAPYLETLRRALGS